MMRLLIALLLLCSCMEPQRLNPGPAAPLSVTALSDHDMAARPVGQMARGTYPLGTYAPGFPGAIYLLHGDWTPWVLAHELAHSCDHNGWTYAQGIAAITPANPSPAFAKRLELLWEIQRGGPDYWLTIYRRWGAIAVQHPDILSRFQ